jgi:uncharacterized protein HemX
MSEGKSWKTPAAVIGIITVVITAIGVYISKKGSDLEKQKQDYQKEVNEADRLNQDKKNEERQTRIADLDRQLKEAENQVQDFEAKIQQTYRQIQDYDFKQNNPSASESDRAEDHKSYLIVRENLDIFSKSKKQSEERVDELRKEINELTK